ncbi:MAG: VanZ family protein [Clostridium sp.]|nr:VanZ family protein [Clostridium sp.]
MQKWIKFVFAVYLLFLIKVIIFKYPYDELYAIVQTWRKDVILEGLGTANFIPFKTVKMYIRYADKLNSFENLAGNILLFVPFGVLLPFIRTAKSKLVDVFANALLLVLGIEVFQLFSAFGAFDVDDIILNCFGAVLGYFVYRAGCILFPALHKINSCSREEKEKEDNYGAYFEKN